MDNFAHLAIDASDLIEALENRLDDGFWVLNLETGEILLGGREDWDSEEEAEEEDYDDPDRFRGIQPLPSHDAFRIMEAFVAGLPEGEGQRSLRRALGHSRPFRAFKDTLLDFLPLREAWFKFHHDRMLELAEEWVEQEIPGARLTLHRPRL